MSAENLKVAAETQSQWRNWVLGREKREAQMRWQLGTTFRKEQAHWMNGFFYLNGVVCAFWFKCCRSIVGFHFDPKCCLGQFSFCRSHSKLTSQRLAALPATFHLHAMSTWCVHQKILYIVASMMVCKLHFVNFHSGSDNQMLQKFSVWSPWLQILADSAWIDEGVARCWSLDTSRI